jgi:hypothetical protein
MSRFIAIKSVIAIISIISIGSEGGIVYAFSPIIVDNSDSIGPLIGSGRVETTGTWDVKNVPGCEGNDYLEASTTNGVEDTLTWIPDLPVSGLYEISACWIDGNAYTWG